MKCPRDGSAMIEGIALNPRAEMPHVIKAFPDPPITAESLRIEIVWKCPRCGHSEIKDRDLSEASFNGA